MEFASSLINDISLQKFWLVLHFLLTNHFKWKTKTECAESTEAVEVGFSVNQNTIAGFVSEDNLFRTAFERSLNHGMENSLSYEPSFF